MPLKIREKPREVENGDVTVVENHVPPPAAVVADRPLSTNDLVPDNEPVRHSAITF